MNFNKDEIKAYIQRLSIIFYALVVGQLFFFGIIYLIARQNGATVSDKKELANIFFFIAPIITFGVIPLGYFLYSQKCKLSIKLNSISEKINAYRTACIIKYALFEIAGFIIIIAFFITNSQQFIYLFAMIIVVFFINKPSEFKFYSDFEVEEDVE